MSKAVIQRYISSEDDFKIICADFDFLVKKIEKFGLNTRWKSGRTILICTIRGIV